MIPIPKHLPAAENPDPPPRRLQRFRATIRKLGLNPYVDVPARISRAFAHQARSGRITIEGTMNSVSIRGTLIPAQGGHRLYVNGGMRSAAGVAVGDRVALALRPTTPERLRPPADIARALARQGARGAFDALTPSHRRELVRYVDDARSPETRRRRIGRLIDHLRGRRTVPERCAAVRALWTCPRCRNQFVNRNQFHSCARRSLSEPFRGRPASIRRMFDRFRAMVESCGPVRLLAYRDHIGFMARVRFCGAFPRKRWLEVGFWLTRRVASPRFRKIETIYPNAHIHRLQILELDDLDQEVEAWVRESYAVGCQEHLGIG